MKPYGTSEFAPGDPPYTIRVEHENGWETVPNAKCWEMEEDTLNVYFEDINTSVEYENGKVVEVK
jgi:hypothetical protein